MKDMFPGFYSSSKVDIDEAWKSDKTLFVFDSNTLINLYRYTEQTREDFYSILDKISDRIWIPYHVGLEYQRRRLGAVKDEKAVFNDIHKLLKKVEQVFEKDFENLSLKNRFPDIHKQTEKLFSKINKHLLKYKGLVDDWDEKQADVRSHDVIREDLMKYFSGRVGPKPENQEILDDIFKLGEKRYKNKVPPGYKDITKAASDNNDFSYGDLYYQRIYGDLIIWFQLMDYVNECDIDSVFFISDDVKEDWWYILDSRGKKPIGPRAELREELFHAGGITLFELYTTSQFLEAGKELLEVEIHDESVDDAERSVQVSLVNQEFEQLAKVSSIFQESERLNDLMESINGIKGYNEAVNSLKTYDSIFDSQIYKINEQYNSLFGTNEIRKLAESINKQNINSSYLRALSDLNRLNPKVDKKIDSDDENE